MLLDTGSSKTVLARGVVGEVVRIRTAGEPVEVVRAAGVRIELLDRVLTYAYFLPSLRELLPRRVSGVLGNDLALQNRTTIDGPGLKLELGADRPEGAGVELQMVGGLPIVRCEIKRPGRAPLPIEALIDTGSVVPLLLTTRAADDLGLKSSDRGGAMLLRTAAKKTNAFLVKLESLTLGGLVLTPETRVLTDGERSYDAVIGWPVLKELRVTLDPGFGRAWFAR